MFCFIFRELGENIRNIFQRQRTSQTRYKEGVDQQKDTKVR